MRIDGEVTFYQFQAQRSDGKWGAIEIYALDPHGDMNAAWREHTASGQCWQRYGEFGFLNRDDALAAIPYVIGKRLFDGPIRIARITKTQATHAVATIEAQ